MLMGGLAQDRIEPTGRGRDGLGLVTAEFVAGIGDGHEIDPWVAAGDALEDRDRTKLVVLSLHHTRRAAHRLERGLVLGPRTPRRGDRMSQDRERVGRLVPS